MNELKPEAKDLENGSVLTDNYEAFRCSTGIDVIAKKDENGDYPMMMFVVKNPDGTESQFFVPRDEISAIAFALARQDQQHKLLNAQFRKYKEVPVRLVIKATKDIKAGDFVVTYRKERVPIEDFNYELR